MKLEALKLHGVARKAANNSFKPNLFRSAKHMAEKTCHVLGSATQAGLTQALGPRYAGGDMPQDPIGFIADPESKYDRVVVAIFGICFQLAEIVLVVGAFQYAGAKTGSVLLQSIASILGFVGALWIGLILPGTIGRWKFWGRVSFHVRLWLALLMIGLAAYGGILYLQAISTLAKAQG